MRFNPILRTDSYKLTHWNQYQPGTQAVYSYFESREGAEFPETVFFGLQPILRSLAGRVVTMDDVMMANELSKVHFGGAAEFNYAGWVNIVRNHNGRLPIRIKAVPEGTPVPVGNVLLTVENTDREAYWLTNALESALTHVWYASNVATLSREVKKLLAAKLFATGGTQDGLPFMLHDFGYRGAVNDEAAAIGGAGHLLNFLGSDTLVAMQLAMEEYQAPLDGLAYSVPATEHSVMTALGKKGEQDVLDQLLASHPEGILSVVADSFNIYDFVDVLVRQRKDMILARNGKFVVRPDSNTARHPNPQDQVVWILETLGNIFGFSVNHKGFKVLDPHVGVLWGDGLDRFGIEKVLNGAMLAGWAAENLVFGMGGGLLQKHNRDTQRSAFKSSAQMRDGTWFDVQKKPLDASKASKKGRLALRRANESGQLITTPLVTTPEAVDAGPDLLETVFENGELLREQTFTDIRARAVL